jgi:hypothetical protein
MSLGGRDVCNLGLLGRATPEQGTDGKHKLKLRREAEEGSRTSLPHRP